MRMHLIFLAKYKILNRRTATVLSSGSFLPPVFAHFLILPSNKMTSQPKTNTLLQGSES